MNKIIETEELKLENRKLQKLYLDTLNKIDRAIDFAYDHFYIDSEFIEELIQMLGGDINMNNNAEDREDLMTILERYEDWGD